MSVHHLLPMSACHAQNLRKSRWLTNYICISCQMHWNNLQFYAVLVRRENTSSEQSESMAKSTYVWYSNLFITLCTVSYGERELCLFNNKPISSHVWYLSSIQHQNVFLIGLLSINLKWLDTLLIWDLWVNYGVKSTSKSNL